MCKSHDPLSNWLHGHPNFYPSCWVLNGLSLNRDLVPFLLCVWGELLNFSELQFPHSK